MVPPKAPLIPTAKPKHAALFDSWSSSSTRHQRAENKAGFSTGWRQSRTAKLSAQFRAGASKQIEPSTGPDPGKSNVFSRTSNTSTSAGNVASGDECSGTLNESPKRSLREKRVFDGLVIYINGSTYPLISDHKLKHLLAEHGAKVSIHLGRKQVTHVIIGTPSTATGSARTGQLSRVGAGGGLASGKMQKEIQKVGGCGIKYVGVEWALESVKAGRRLPEAQFANMNLTLNGQKSVRGSFFSVQASSNVDCFDKKISDG